MSPTIQTAIDRAIEEGFQPGAIVRTGDGTVVHLICGPYAGDGSLMMLGRIDPRDASTWLEVSVDDLAIISLAPTPTPGDAVISTSPEPAHDP